MENDSFDNTFTKNLYHLAPRPAEDREVQIETLLWAIEDENIENIAISGPYGSGKSSILKGFSCKFPNYKLKYISFSSFDENTSEEHHGSDTNSHRNIKNRQIRDKIESNILKQLFFSEKPKNIPFSRFKRIQKIDTTSWAKTIMLLLMAILWLLIPEFFNSTDWISKGVTHLLTLFAIIVLVFKGFEIIKAIIPLIINLRITKFGFANSEFESVKNREDSILAKYLDEIIYFFESTENQIIVFEDIDRNKTVALAILTHLREINKIINRSIKSKKIAFLFLIKDDIFGTNYKNRTKFFDFIIPVLPAVGYKNSKERLLEWNNDFSSQNQSNINLPDNFIKDVASYIDDYRTLYNIWNEYVIYFELFQQKHKSYFKKEEETKVLIKPQQLFSLVIFKNLYPDEFEDIRQNGNQLELIFINFINGKKNKELELRRRKEEIEIQQREIEKMPKIEESLLLPALLASAIKISNLFSTNIEVLLEDKEGRTSYRRINTLNTVGNLDNFKSIFQNNTLNGYRVNNQPEEITEPRNLYQEYLQKIKIINDSSEEAKKKISQDKISVEAQLKETINYSVKNYCQNIPPELEDWESKYLLQFFLHRGYIESDFHDYLFIIEPFSLNQKELLCLNQIKSGIFKQTDHDIDYLKIALELQEQDFSSSKILIPDLILRLFEYKGDEKEDIQNKIKAFKNFTDTHLEYHIEFYKILLEKAEKKIKHFFFILSNTKSYKLLEPYSSKNVISTSRNLLLNLHPNYTEKLPEDFKNELQHILNTDTALFGENVPEDSFVYENIRELEIKIKNFSIDKEIAKKKKLVKYIIENFRYELNYKNIEAHFKFYDLGNDEFHKYLKKPLSYFESQDILNYLSQNVNNNIDIYASEVLIHSEYSINETHSEYVNLINRLKEPAAQKFLADANIKSLIEHIEDVDNHNLWPILLRRNLLEPQWINLCVYQEKFSDNEELENYLFLDNVKKNLSIEVSEIQNYLNTYFDIFIKYIFNKNTTEEINTYLKDLKNDTELGSYIKNNIEDNIEAVSKSALIVLIQNNLLPITETLIDFFKGKDSELYVDYLIRNSSILVDENRKIQLSSNDLNKILKSELSDNLLSRIVIKNFGDRNITDNETLIADVLSREKVIFGIKLNLLENLVIKIAPKLNELTLAKLLGKYLKEIVEEDLERVLSFLSKLSNVIYNKQLVKLGQKNKVPKIHYSSESFVLFENLKRLEIIKNYKIDEKRKFISGKILASKEDLDQ
ncbi:putative membrane protein YobI [Marivirga tractuosa]|uniref:YobI-like P-loop NTPase domain-containing protein n=1 Tax=Marivirga tractuosa (strain ATCC 23168 / DSM 4126 / NBRC 15989 / NCIMB 1408 / VKM B-1430 / H-43) TaxID=643867 RepID=E4TLA1_MARTH|nr:hypothetical protein [Marivirga tractuosa]ADR20239.1 hypothetical protein Ftrac_0228 [Marivirga tractuosa DSM 4126]BDD15320.1 putative membrane protein YobI [Marivirga tractuosa]